MIDDLSKTNLLAYCLTTNLKSYLPDKVNEDSVTRSFILKIIFHKDNEKFKTLENIAKSINKFKSEKAIGGVNVSVPKVFLEELGRFESNINTNKNSRVYSSLSNSIFMKNNMQVIGLSKEEKKNKRKKDLEEFMKNNNINRNSYDSENVNLNRINNNNIN